MKTMAARWDSFNLLVVPANASATQRREMRRAFYAGAAELMESMCEIDDAGLDEEAEAAACDALYGELQAFGKAVETGHA